MLTAYSARAAFSAPISYFVFKTCKCRLLFYIISKGIPEETASER